MYRLLGCPRKLESMVRINGFVLLLIAGCLLLVVFVSSRLLLLLSGVLFLLNWGPNGLRLYLNEEKSHFYIVSKYLPNIIYNSFQYHLLIIFIPTTFHPSIMEKEYGSIIPISSTYYFNKIEFIPISSKDQTSLIISASSKAHVKIILTSSQHPSKIFKDHPKRRTNRGYYS